MPDYNGWSNYPTWRVNLELIEGMSADDFNCDKVEDLASALESYVDELLEQDGGNFALAYARVFVSEVNWHQIAEHLKESE